jgi:uncharacterized protein YfdQ (DUF2303 family)
MARSPQPTDDAQGDVQAALATILPLHGAERLPVQSHTFAVMPEGLKPVSLRALWQEWQPFPERRVGVAHHDTVDSLIAHANRFKDADTAVFAKLSETDPSFQVVYDYHRQRPPEQEEAARNLKHRAAHKPVISEPWKAWKAIDGKPLGQAEFGAFLEDRILDIAPPLAEEEAANNPLVKALGGRIGTQQDLLTASRGMRIKENAEVTSVHMLDTGEVEVAYKTELRTADNQPLRMPTCFAVQTPVYEGGPLYLLWMRLRFRRQEGEIIWTLVRWRPDMIVRHALTEIAEKIGADTSLPVFIGSPEA